MALNIIHYIYLIIIGAIILAMCFKKDVVLICILGIGIIGFMVSGNPIATIQILYKAILVSAKEFVEIVIIISLVNMMSKALKLAAADELMISPVKKMMINDTMAFFVLGITMLILSWFIWPTPAVAFIGAIMIPAAIKSGLSASWAAVAINIFGNGMALSSDYFIQGAPSITAKTAGSGDPFKIIHASIPLWAAMSLTVTIVSFIMLKRENKLNKMRNPKLSSESLSNKLRDNDVNTPVPAVKSGAKLLAVITPVLFLMDLSVMYIYKLKGSESTSLIGGTAIIIMIAASIIQYGFGEALGQVTGLVREGAMFGIRVFAPIIIIGAFFFLGSKGSASEILGISTEGFLTEVGTYISNSVRLNKLNIILMEAGVSALLGVGGSGFSGLPLVGTLAGVFSASFHINREGLAALGQIITIWIGGGTIIPWSVVPVAAMCDIQPFELVKKNLIPVTSGICITILLSLLIL